MDEDVQVGSARAQNLEQAQGTGAGGHRRRALWAEAVTAVAVVAIAVTGIFLATSAHPPTGRGERVEVLPSSTPVPSFRSTPVPADVSVSSPQSSAGGDVSSPVDVWADARSSLSIPALTRTDCLDAAAKKYAADVAKSSDDSAPTVPAQACGSGVRFGFTAGFDKTGVGQAMAAMSAGPNGPSPLVATASRKVGFAVVASHGSTGAVNGYVLAWAVSS